MKFINRYAPVTLCAIAGILAFAIANEPGEAEASRDGAITRDLRMSIHDRSSDVARRCPEAVWPNLAAECILHSGAETATRSIRRIEVDDRTIRQKREELYRISIGG
ncbi:hypothetical protein EDC22_10410 [Tepidamorphus gemmatus]|jgi:hypothetical protein|uniref:UrcA family protein n=1 Tax=Tepidamorphus gemmatus TaxID=747076 RepID=A0A4R3MG44_9HYPH|nr:hypothetical protein [Tepidamorphus gemmatus]TCT11257.1 hypothetical protein EDC22_10410 [Tepidamorphus gemmatus]